MQRAEQRFQRGQRPTRRRNFPTPGGSSTAVDLMLEAADI